MDQSTRPRPRSVRLDALALSSTEAFVLSQIDGTATLDEVADATGVPVGTVLSIAGRLEELGAIDCSKAAARTATSGRYAEVARPPVSAPPDGARLLRVPRRTDADVYGMKLETGDAFLLSNVDGLASVQELADVLGDDAARVMQRVDVLIRAGALELREPSKRPSAPRTRGAAKVADPPPHRAGRRSGAHDVGGGAKSSRKLVAAAPVGNAKSGRHSKAPPIARGEASRRPSRVDHQALPRHPVLEDAEVPPSAAPLSAPPRDGETCDLDPESRARIDAATAAPEGRTHYAVLGVPPFASAKEISRAYFGLAATLHPDRYFGKRLGPYKKKLEQAFRTASDAYEVLRSPERRAEYDAYLGLKRRSVEMEAALAPPEAAPLVPPAPPARTPTPPIAGPIESTPAPEPAPVIIVTKEREALSPVPAPLASPPPPPRTLQAPTISKAPTISEAPTSSNVEPPAPNSRPHSSARRILAATKSASLLEGAQHALVQGDATAAANLYRLALEYADDPTSRAYAQSGLNEARSIVADTYMKRAVYEEKEARWPEAVASYEKALDRRPDDPAICERLANALRQEGQDLLRATRLAELAVSRTPRNANYRRTLGLVYADGGLRDKALEQFEKAFELDPSDEVTKRALASLKKQRR